MCGLTGFFKPQGLSAVDRQGIVEILTEKLRHRGPDDTGTWVDADAGIALGHRRLAVLDLSLAGRQPMVSATGRYVLVLNGEIYNHVDLRKELAGSSSQLEWRGHSDTETLLAGFDRWGIENVLKKTVGMFAIALWDRQERVLTLARDRLGEKPLYYGWQAGVFLFGSELKALQAHPGFQGDIDRDVLAAYMCRGYIEGPYSIYRNVFKLLPGAYLQLSMQDSPGNVPQLRRYWSLLDAVEFGVSHPFAGSDREALDELQAELARAVSLQCVADVPVGAFLSGGIDSTTIVALMQARASRPVKTFTIGFHESDYQEAEHAKAVAQHLHTDHTELYVTAREAMEVIPRLPQLYDEPFGDSSAIPTFLVSQLARRKVTVSLSGDGGDELFGGYKRYGRTADIWRSMQRIPYPARKALSYAFKAFGCNARKASYLSASAVGECYRAQTSLRVDQPNFVLGADDASSGVGIELNRPTASPYDVMMYADTLSYLPDDILVKVDRASMAVSLETRVPMLDHRVVEFAWRLPLHLKVRHHESKWLLKQLLGRYIPAALLERPKMGFGVPVGRWLRGPLREWAEDLLSPERLQEDGFLNVRGVREQWSRHVNGRSNEDDSLWTVLMFQAWLRGGAAA